MQGVLLDRNSMLVAYDYKRGEDRGKFHKNEERTIGDCIDCEQCVKVCPTGIDIRNGTQLAFFNVQRQIVFHGIVEVACINDLLCRILFLEQVGRYGFVIEPSNSLTSCSAMLPFG